MNTKARIYIYHGLYSDAIKTMKKIKRFINDPGANWSNDPEVDLNSLHFYMANVYEKLDRPNDAIKLYTRITEEKPPELYELWKRGYINRSLFAIGKIKFDQRDYNAAFPILKEFVTSMNGTNPNEKEVDIYDARWKLPCFFPDIDEQTQHANAMLSIILKADENDLNT